MPDLQICFNSQLFQESQLFQGVLVALVVLQIQGHPCQMRRERRERQEREKEKRERREKRGREKEVKERREKKRERRMERER